VPEKRMSVASERLDELDDLAPDPGVRNFLESLVQVEDLSGGPGFWIGRGDRLAGTCAPAGKAFEEIARRDIQDVAQLPKLRGTDPVGAAFILLDLLKADPELARELLLGHSAHFASGPHTAPDMGIDRIRHW
jgi:hypothetical protein